MKKFLTLAAALALMLCLTTCAFTEEEPEPDYLALMTAAAVSGDIDGGRGAQALRDAQIDAARSGETKVSFDELYLLSKFIYLEAGNPRRTQELRMCVGEVVLNRVASPEYPDSLPAVVYQQGEFEGVRTEEFIYRTRPSKDCVEAALRLLLGERLLADCVLSWSDEPEGAVFARFGDRLLGYTYFFQSPNIELYSDEGAPAWLARNAVRGAA